MVTEGALQPQVEAKDLEPEKAGELTPQPEGEELEQQPGAEKEPQGEVKPPKERMYSETEWRKRESAKDKEIAQYKNLVTQTTLQSQIKEAEQREREALTQDKAKVEQGLMTDDEAKRNEALRQRETRVYVESMRINADKETISKVKVAEDIAKEYGIDSKVLLTDDVKSPVDMIRKAAGLALKQRDEKLEEIAAEVKTLKSGDQKFDSGQKAAVSEDDSLEARYPNSPTLFKNKKKK